MKTFIDECRADKNRFDRPIKKNTLKNFATEIFKNKKSSKNHIDQTRTERNVLGQVLCLALKREIDLTNLLSYPLTRVPHSIAHCDGTMLSHTQKGELVAIFMSKNEHQHIRSPTNFDVDVIDGFYLLNSLRDPPTKYGHLSSIVLKHLCNTTAHEIHIIFDKFESPCPKDVDMRKNRELYDELAMNFSIRGPNQERTSSLAKCLLNKSFREELVKFFIDAWSKDENNEAIINDKRVFLSFGRFCYLFSNDFEKGKLVQNFENNHFEVETKMIMHMHRIRAINATCRIRTPNPDIVLIYTLYHMQFWPNERRIFIETGDINKNTVQQIDVRQIFGSLNPVFINALPAWFVLTGYTHEPAFYGKGRKTCLRALEKDVAFQIAFGNIGSIDHIHYQESIAAIEKFTCCLYNAKTESVNQARVNIFEKAYGSCNDVDFNKKGDFWNKIIFVCLSKHLTCYYIR